MKLSAKLVTALAAVALLAVALAGVTGTTLVQAATNGTVDLDKAWYTDGSTVEITVTDPDEDFSSSTTTEVDHPGSDEAIMRGVDLADNLADANGDGSINSQDFDVTTRGGDATDCDDGDDNVTCENDDFTVLVVDAPSGTIDLKFGGSSTSTQQVDVHYEIDQVQTISGKVTITSDQDTDGLTLDVTEEEPASDGTFKVTVQIDAAEDGETSTTTDPQTLSAPNGNTITVTYTDETPSTGTSRETKDQAKIETAGPTIEVVGPVDGKRTQERRPTFKVRITDNESGVDPDEITFTVGGTDHDPDETTSAGGVVTAEFQPSDDLEDENVETDVAWSVTAKDIAGNQSATDSDDDTAGDQDHTVTVDRAAPEIDSATTGDWWDTSIETDDKTNSSALGADHSDKVNSLQVVFSEDLNTGTISEADFEVGGVAPSIAFISSDAQNSVFLTTAADFDPDDTPTVEVVGSIADVAGNTTAVGDVEADDGIAPTITASLSKSLTKTDVVLTISANEALAGNVPNVAVHTPSGTTTDEKAITGILVKGTNQWEVTIDVADDGLADGDQAVEITGNDSAGNAAALGGDDPDADDALTFEVDTGLAAPDLSGELADDETRNPSPFITIEYGEEVSITAVTLDGNDMSDVIATTDDKRWILKPSDLSLGDHKIVISATDAAGNERDEDELAFEVKEKAEFELSLFPGWNLVSLPADPVDPSINSVITSADVSTVVSYDASSQSFRTAVRDSATGQLSGNLSQLDSMSAFWVQTSSFDPIKVELMAPEGGQLPPQVDLSAGWNLVPVVDASGEAAVGEKASGTDLTSTNDYFTGVDVQKVWGFDTLEDKFEAIPMSATDNVVLGKGYWVFVKEDATLIP